MLNIEVIHIQYSTFNIPCSLFNILIKNKKWRSKLHFFIIVLNKPTKSFLRCVNDLRGHAIKKYGFEWNGASCILCKARSIRFDPAGKNNGECRNYYNSQVKQYIHFQRSFLP